MLLTRRALFGSLAVTLSTASAIRPAGAEAVFALEAHGGSAQILAAPQPPTRIRGFGGQTPGPTLRSALGAPWRVRLSNRLDEPTALHWRGMRLPNAIDGAAGLVQPPLAPGETREEIFTPPDAGLYLYQPLIQPLSGKQLAQGLFGAAIVDENPKIFSDHDLILTFSDWRLDHQAQIIADFDDPADVRRQGRLGAYAGFNGSAGILRQNFAPNARLRLRLINAASARIMELGLPGADAKIIALDGQFCEPFAPLERRLPLGPGARCELLVDLPATEGEAFAIFLRGEAELPDSLLFAATTQGAPAPKPPPIATPPLNPLLPAEIRLDRAEKRELTLTGGWSPQSPKNVRTSAEALKNTWAINGVSSDGLSGPPLFSVRRGTPVTLGFANKTFFTQVMHVQGHALRLLHDLDDGWEPYWRDSVIVQPKKTKHVAFIADNPGRWLICSAIQDHFAHGLAAWFEVA